MNKLNYADVRQLYTSSKALADSAKLPLVVSIALRKQAKKALSIIEEGIGTELDEYEARKKAIRERVQPTFDASIFESNEAANVAFQNECFKEKEYQEIYAAEIAAFNQEAASLEEFPVVKMPACELSLNDTHQVVHRELMYKVNLHLAFLDLVENELIEIE